MTQEKLLSETLMYFSENPQRRCFTQKKCCYSPVTSNQQNSTAGCAIGRWMDPINAQILDNELVGGIRKVMADSRYKLLLPEWMQSMDSEFLALVQDLHDFPGHWDNKGLTKIGHQALDRIKSLLNK